MPENEVSAANTLSAVKIPDNMNLSVSHVLTEMQNRGITVAGGLYPDIKYFRVGHMSKRKQGYLRPIKLHIQI